MRRGMLGAVGVALGVGVLAATVSTIDTASAQEREGERPRVRMMAFGGSGGWLGARIQDVDEELAEEAGLPGVYGARVESVVEDGPAAGAGLEEGDVIARWNGDRVESVAELQRLLRETPGGRTVTLGLIRSGDERDVRVELGDRADRAGHLRMVVPTPDEARRLRLRSPRPLREREITVRPRQGVGGFLVARGGRLGVSIQRLGSQLAEFFGVEGGALVTSVTEDSPAEAAGLRAGDVIVGIGDEQVEEPGDLIGALRERGAGPVSVRIVRDRQEREVTVELEERGLRGGADHGGLRVWTDEGPASFRVESFELPEIELGPMELEGFEMEPRSWRFDLDWSWGDAEPIEVRVPRIEVPGLEVPAIRLPAIEVPGFDLQVPAAPRVRVVTSV